MVRKCACVSFAAVLALALVLLVGCPGTTGGGGGGGGTDTNDDGGNGDGNGDGTDGGMTDGDGTDGNGDGDAVTLTPVKTNIDVHNGGRIAVGDDLLVYGYGGFAGVDYIIPSANDTEGRGLPDGDTFVAGSFAVAGKKIALVGDFLVTIFDTEAETATEIPGSQIRLVNVPAGLYAQGHITADGPYIACRNDASSNGSLLVKVIDVSGDTPQVLTFTNNPATSVDHIAVDGDARRLAVAAGDSFYIYDIDDPSAPPAVYVTNSSGIGDNIFTFDGGYVFYEDGEAFGNAMFLNTVDGSFTQLTANPSAGEQCHNGGTFVYMLDRDAGDSNGNDSRSAIGTVPGPGATLAGDSEIDGSTTNNGFFGWSQACSVTPDGAFAFLSGTGSIGSGEFLQVSTGGAFTLPADPDGSSEYGLPATDVVTSATLVGFKTGDGTTAGASTKVGYIRLGNR